MFTNRTNRKLLLLAVLLLVFSASDFAGPNARAVVSLDLISENGDGNRACQADFDNNGIVEFADFLSFVAAFNTSSGDANFNALMDMDGNDVIDFRDFLLFANVFGKTCEPPVVASVTVSPSSASIKEEETQQFSATAYDSDDAEMSGKTFAWSSSSVSVATIDSSGLATAVDTGSTTITATVDGKSGTASLTVTQSAPRNRTGTISGRNNYSSGGSVTLSETSDGKLKLSITGLSTPNAAPDVFVALYTSNSINWPIRGSLPAGAVEFGEVTRQSGK